jgi:hypothetical protein
MPALLALVGNLSGGAPAAPTSGMSAIEALRVVEIFALLLTSYMVSCFARLDDRSGWGWGFVCFVIGLFCFALSWPFLRLLASVAACAVLMFADRLLKPDYDKLPTSIRRAWRKALKRLLQGRPQPFKKEAAHVRATGLNPE